MMAQLNYWKLAVWKAFSGSLMIILAGLPGVLLGCGVDPIVVAHISAPCGMIIAVLKFLDGFFDQTFSRLAQGKPMVQLPGMNGNHTEILTKETAEKITETTINTIPPPK